MCMPKKSYLVYDVTGNYLLLISFQFASDLPKWPVKRSINLKWPNLNLVQEKTASGIKITSKD